MRANRTEKKLCTFAPSKLHGRDKVAVAGNEHNDLNLSFQRQSSNIHADAHIDTLLTDLWIQIFCTNLYSGPFGFIERTRPDCPALKCQLTEAKRHVWLLRKLVKETTRSLRYGGSAELHCSAAKRLHVRRGQRS